MDTILNGSVPFLGSQFLSDTLRERQSEMEGGLKDDNAEDAEMAELDPHAPHLSEKNEGMDSQEFIRELERDVQPNPPPAVASAADAPAPMDVDVPKPPSEYKDPIIRGFANLVRDVRAKIRTDDQKEARDKANEDKSKREADEAARKLGDPDTTYGRQVLGDVTRTLQAKKVLGIDVAELEETIRKRCTFVAYRNDDDEDVKCSLLDLPEDVTIDDTVPIFTIKKYQTEAAVKLFKNLINHHMSLLTFKPGKGKTYTALATATEIVKRGLAKGVAVVAPNQLINQWGASIKMIAGTDPDHEVFAVSTDTIKNRAALLHQIRGSKAPLVFVLVCSSLFCDWDNYAVLKAIFETLDLPWVVLGDECHIPRRNDDTISTVSFAQVFGEKNLNMPISATPFVNGSDTEKHAIVATSNVTFDARPVSEAARKPREHTAVDPRKCSSAQLTQMFKNLSVGTLPGDDKPEFPPGAIFNVKVPKTPAATTPGMELQSYGMNWGENYRLLAAVGLTIECHIHQKGLHEEGRIDNPMNVVLIVNNVTAINDIARNLSRLGYTDNVVVIHGQLPAAAKAKNIDRMLNEYGLILLATPGMCDVGLNMQNTCSTLIVSCKSYMPQRDFQLESRIKREGQKETWIVFYMYCGYVDERVAVLSNAKTEATAAFYDVDPNTEVPWSLEPTRSITNADFRPFVHGVYAAAQAGFAVNTQFAAPIWNSMLRPPMKEERPKLDAYLKSYVCPKVQRAQAEEGFELDY